jgi:hypothetical protein
VVSLPGHPLMLREPRLERCPGLSTARVPARHNGTAGRFSRRLACCAVLYVHRARDDRPLVSMPASLPRQSEPLHSGAGWALSLTGCLTFMVAVDGAERERQDLPGLPENEPSMNVLLVSNLLAGNL